MKYSKTLFFLKASNIKPCIQVGQWVQASTGIRGQYLGQTDSGAIVIRWQNGKFSKRDAINNRYLRMFAKAHGSK